MKTLFDRVAVIDIGSNSVRLMMSENGKTLYKKVEITRLSHGLGADGRINLESAERTSTAVLRFYREALSDNAKKVYAFATAAVRSAINGKEFVDGIFNACGLKVDIISGNLEAEIGFLGATLGEDGGVLDIGGASTEIIVKKAGKTEYSKSIGIGVVKLFDWANNDKVQTQNIIDVKVSEYGIVPRAEFYAIGGTATSLAAVMQELEPYDPKKVHGYVLNIERLEKLKEYLFSLDKEQRRKIKGLQPQRADVIAGGTALLISIMKKIGITEITVSESDNLEGYLLKIRSEYE